MDREDSQALEPEWTTAQQMASDKLVSIDCAAEAKACHQLAVSSFPKIRLHHSDGTQTRYRGPRKAASLTGFLRRTARPTISSLTPENKTAFQAIDDVVLIGRFRPETNLLTQFMTIAEQYHDRYSFGIASVQQGPAMECYNNVDGVQRSTTEFPSPTSIETFVRLCATPLIPEMTRRNELSFYKVSLSSSREERAPYPRQG